MYPHGGCGNHGCEAIVRSTLCLTGAEAVLASGAPEEDRLYGLDQCCRIIRDKEPLKRFSAGFVRASLQYYLWKDQDAFDRLAFRPLFHAAENCDIALSIGGDNYCYGEPKYLYLINRELKKRGVKTILWGCSLDPDTLRGEMLDDLMGYDRIVTRESLSCKALRAKGLANVSLFPDPAFALNRKETVLPDGFVEGNTVGINVSPLVLSHEKSQDLVLSNYAHLIETILNETDMAVSLIPHVVRAQNDDRGPLGRLFSQFKESERLSLAADRSAEELKDLLARCRFVVAARTHASIAAYSSMVPTLVLGYSTKAWGIAQDIMPQGKTFIIPCTSLDSKASLSSSFLRLVSSEQEIRTHLRTFIPDYIARLNDLTLS